MLALARRVRRLVVGAARAFGVRRAVLAIGFVGIAMGAAACSDNGPPSSTCAPGSPSGSLTNIPPQDLSMVGAGTTNTTITFTSSQCPSVVGQAVTFVVTLAPPSGQSTAPTGIVAIGTNTGQGGTNQPFPGCDQLPLSPPSGQSTNYTAKCTTTFTTPSSSGGIKVVAGYLGDGTFAPNAATLTQQVDKASTTTTIAGVPPSPSPPVYGQPVTFNATVTVTSPGAGTPTHPAPWSWATTP